MLIDAVMTRPQQTRERIYRKITRVSNPHTF
jgi:hypothetical protein